MHEPGLDRRLGEPAHLSDGAPVEVHLALVGFLEVREGAVVGLVVDDGGGVAWDDVHAIEDCADANIVLALERWDAAGASKADIFSKDTLRTYLKMEQGQVKDVGDAIALSLNESGKLNIHSVMTWTGLSESEIVKKFTDEGMAYNHPTGGWQTSDEYLTGNVVEKLKEARAAVAIDQKFLVNCEALERVQPARIHHDDIRVNLGSAWIPPSDLVAFSSETLGCKEDAFHIAYDSVLGKWTVEWSNAGRYLAHSQVSKMVWGTEHANYITILESVILRRPIAIYKKDNRGNDYQDENGHRRIDREATEAVAAKGVEIEERFRDWLWEDESRRERLTNFYNDTYNSVVQRSYNGSHLTFPGMSRPCIFDNGVPFNGLREHQRDAVWQTICRGNALLGHEVGTGKTMTEVAIAMELRRLGMARKPCLLCLKSNIHAITNEAQQLYPAARILSAYKEFDAQTREETIARIATGDWDLIILTHDQFSRISISADFVKRYVEEKLSHLNDLIQSAGGDPEDDDEHIIKKSRNREVKQLAKARLRLRERIAVAVESERDTSATFEQTGIDFLIVDEAHKFKAMPIHTAMNSVKGIPNGDSGRAVNMEMIVSYLHYINNGRGLVMATGTPVVNSLCEVYVMQRFVQPNELRKRGIQHFDAWASNFGAISSRMEFTHTGDYKSVQRFTKFVNLPELQQIAFQDFSLVRANKISEISRPKRVDVPVSIRPTEMHIKGMEWLQERARTLEHEDVDPRDDNHLSIATDGRLLASDLRLIMNDVPAHCERPSKVSQVAVEAGKVLSLHPGKVQLVFTEINQSSRTGFSLLEELTSELIATGITREQIEVFSGMSDVQRMNAAARLNDGVSLIGIGNTQTLGTGINCQRNLIAVHHLDCPWTPAAMEQRNGRVWRQGNTNKSIVVYSYVVEKTLDSWMYQTLSRKERFIRAFMDGQKQEREIKDEDEESISYDRIMAIASGNPLLYERINVVSDIDSLERAEARHQKSHLLAKSTLSRNRMSVDSMRATVERMTGDVEAWQQHRGTDFSFSAVDGRVYESAQLAGKYVMEQLLSTPPSTDALLGRYRGFELMVRSVRAFMDWEVEVVMRRSEDSLEWAFRPSVKSLEDQADLFISINSRLSGIVQKQQQEKLQIERVESASEKLEEEIGKLFRGSSELSRKRMILAAIDDALSRGESRITGVLQEEKN